MAEIHLVTGYLGSGKTQFLSRLLERALLREKIAVIVNDFGAVMFDGIHLRQAQMGVVPTEASSVEILEVPGGCLCCSAIDDFRDALRTVLERGVDRVFIEATGLADAAQVQRDLAFMHFPIDSTLCVVDTLNIHRFRALFHIVDAQIASADVLLLSKTDIATPERITTAHRVIDAINARAVRITLDKGRMGAESLIPLFAPQRHFVPHPERHIQEHLLHEQMTAFRVFLPARVRRTDMDKALASLPTALVRLKGVIRFEDSSNPVLVSYIAGAWNYTSIASNHSTTHQATTNHNTTHQNAVRHYAHHSSTLGNEMFAIGSNVHPQDVTEAFRSLNARIETGTVRSVAEHNCQ